MRGGEAGDRRVFPSWCGSARSSDGGLNQDGSRGDGQKSRDLRGAGG